MFVSKTPYVYPTLNSGALNEFRAMECIPIVPTQMEHTQESFQVLKCVKIMAYEGRNNSKI